MAKVVSPTIFELCADISLKKDAGEAVDLQEISLQETFDNATTSELYYNVPEQKLTGYVTPDGITMIFFYNNNDRLVGVESDDMFNWNVIANF